MLPDALHSIRSLLCTATNQTPHERLFNYKRKSSFETSVPIWLSAPGSAYLKRHVRASKYEPVVDEVDLVHTTPNYAVVHLPSGRETTVSLRDIAPCNSEEPVTDNDASVNDDRTIDVNLNDSEVIDNSRENEFSSSPAPENLDNSFPEQPRRSNRARKAVDRYGAVPYV